MSQAFQHRTLNFCSIEFGLVVGWQAFERSSGPSFASPRLASPRPGSRIAHLEPGEAQPQPGQSMSARLAARFCRAWDRVCGCSLAPVRRQREASSSNLQTSRLCLLRPRYDQGVALPPGRKDKQMLHLLRGQVAPLANFATFFPRFAPVHATSTENIAPSGTSSNATSPNASVSDTVRQHVRAPCGLAPPSHPSRLQPTMGSSESADTTIPT